MDKAKQAALMTLGSDHEHGEDWPCWRGSNDSFANDAKHGGSNVARDVDSSPAVICDEDVIMKMTRWLVTSCRGHTVTHLVWKGRKFDITPGSQPG